MIDRYKDILIFVLMDVCIVIVLLVIIVATTRKHGCNTPVEKTSMTTTKETDESRTIKITISPDQAVSQNQDKRLINDD